MLRGGKAGQKSYLQDICIIVYETRLHLTVTNLRSRVSYVPGDRRAVGVERHLQEGVEIKLTKVAREGFAPRKNGQILGDRNVPGTHQNKTCLISMIGSGAK